MDGLGLGLGDGCLDGLCSQPQQQQAVLRLADTGSFTGWHPLGVLGSGYLSAGQRFAQPLCGNDEGWGPLSPIRYDFTPCFIDVWIASVAAFGLFAGSIALAWLIRKKTPIYQGKDWHFWTKQVRLCA